MSRPTASKCIISPTQTHVLFNAQRKCAIFGIYSEGHPQQINYLIDEGMCSSKGSNGVISYLDHLILWHGRTEKEQICHAVLCLESLTKQHQNVGLNFMVSRHTKFAPDWCFGLCKQSFSRTYVSSLDDINDAFVASTPESHAQTCYRRLAQKVEKSLTECI